jgi:hypothetical protein
MTKTDSIHKLTSRLEVLTQSAVEPGKRGWQDFEAAQEILKEYLDRFPQNRQKAIDVFLDLAN